MGSFFAKSKKPSSRVTDHDKAVLQLKQQRDRLKQYQKRVELSLEKDRQLVKKCLQNGRKDRAKLLLRKKKFQETLLTNSDKQLENLEKLASDLEFAQVELHVLDGLKQGNLALKKMHEVLNIDDIETIMDETREGIEKQQELDSLLFDVLTSEDEISVLAELDALADEDSVVKLPDVPSEALDESAEDDKSSQTPHAVNEKPKKVLVEA